MTDKKNTASNLEEFNEQARAFAVKAKQQGASNTAIKNSVMFMAQLFMDDMSRQITPYQQAQLDMQREQFDYAKQQAAKEEWKLVDTNGDGTLEWVNMGTREINPGGTSATTNPNNPDAALDVTSGGAGTGTNGGNGSSVNAGIPAVPAGAVTYQTVSPQSPTPQQEWFESGNDHRIALDNWLDSINPFNKYSVDDQGNAQEVQWRDNDATIKQFEEQEKQQSTPAPSQNQQYAPQPNQVLGAFINPMGQYR